MNKSNGNAIEFINVSATDETVEATEKDISIDKSFKPDIANNMINHMNEDHVDAMVDYCRYAGITLDNLDPVMVAIGREGFILELDKRRIKFEFAEQCNTPVDVRKALVALAQKARESLNA